MPMGQNVDKGRLGQYPITTGPGFGAQKYQTPQIEKIGVQTSRDAYVDKSAVPQTGAAVLVAGLRSIEDASNSMSAVFRQQQEDAERVLTLEKSHEAEVLMNSLYDKEVKHYEGTNAVGVADKVSNMYAELRDAFVPEDASPKRRANFTTVFNQQFSNLLTRARGHESQEIENSKKSQEATILDELKTSSLLVTPNQIDQIDSMVAKATEKLGYLHNMDDAQKAKAASGYREIAIGQSVSKAIIDTPGKMVRNWDANIEMYQKAMPSTFAQMNAKVNTARKDAIKDDAISQVYDVAMNPKTGKIDYDKALSVVTDLNFIKSEGPYKDNGGLHGHCDLADQMRSKYEAEKTQAIHVQDALDRKREQAASKQVFDMFADKTTGHIANVTGALELIEKLRRGGDLTTPTATTLKHNIQQDSWTPQDAGALLDTIAARAGTKTPMTTEEVTAAVGGRTNPAPFVNHNTSTIEQSKKGVTEDWFKASLDHFDILSEKDGGKTLGLRKSDKALFKSYLYSEMMDKKMTVYDPRVLNELTVKFLQNTIRYEKSLLGTPAHDEPKTWGMGTFSTGEEEGALWYLNTFGKNPQKSTPAEVTPSVRQPVGKKPQSKLEQFRNMSTDEIKRQQSGGR